MILDVSRWKGRIHDLKVFEGSGLVGRFGSCKVKGWLDKEYEVIEGIAKGWEIKKPKKKPKGRDLTEEERGRNKGINLVRVKVEHKILAMKRYQVFGGRYRGMGRGYDREGRIVGRIGEHGANEKDGDGIG